MTDKPVLMYVKDNMLYPIALTIEQEETFDILMCLMPGKIHYIKDKPLGEVMEVRGNAGNDKSFSTKN